MAEGEQPATSRIFVSYRREDAAGFVRALLGPLRERFGSNRIFKDTDNIPPGLDFVKVIQGELESCKVLLAVIGNEWMTVRDHRTGTRRLDNPADTLRIEVAAALENEHTTVIPVLVDRAGMPASEDLPENLRPLARRNAIELSDSRWDSDVERLIRAIEAIFSEPTRTEATEAAEGKEPAVDASSRSFERLEIKRKRQIAEHLKAAREAWEARDFQAVIAACERAIWLDPQEPEARELAAQAQAALDEQNTQDRLADARAALAKGDLSAASEDIDEALARRPNHPDAVKLRQDLLRVRSERDREREVERQVSVALKAAQAAVDEEDFPAAQGYVEDALALAPESRDALKLQAQIAAAREESQRRRDLKRRAQQAVADAQADLAAGNPEAALDRLRRFSPPHELVSQALETLQPKVAEQKAASRLEKVTNDAAEVAARAKEDAAARTRADAAAKLVVAEIAFQKKDFVAAQQLVEAARALDPTNAEVGAWATKIHDAVDAEAADRAARENAARLEREEAARKQKEEADRPEHAKRLAAANRQSERVERFHDLVAAAQRAWKSIRVQHLAAGALGLAAVVAMLIVWTRSTGGPKPPQQPSTETAHSDGVLEARANPSAPGPNTDTKAPDLTGPGGTTSVPGNNPSRPIPVDPPGRSTGPTRTGPVPGSRTSDRPRTPASATSGRGASDSELPEGPPRGDVALGTTAPPITPSDPQRGGRPDNSAPVDPSPGAAPVRPNPIDRPRPAPPRPSQPDPTQQAKAEIRQLLDQYVAAYAEKNEAVLKAIDPSFRGIPGRELIKSVSLSFDQPQIDVSPDGQTAALRATGSFTYVWNRAGLPPKNPAQLTWNLQKHGTVWVIVSSR